MGFVFSIDCIYRIEKAKDVYVCVEVVGAQNFSFLQKREKSLGTTVLRNRNQSNTAYSDKNKELLQATVDVARLKRLLI